MRRKISITINALIRKLYHNMAREVRLHGRKKVKLIIDMLVKDLGRVESIDPSLEKPFTEVKLVIY